MAALAEARRLSRCAEPTLEHRVVQPLQPPALQGGLAPGQRRADVQLLGHVLRGTAQDDDGEDDEE